MSKGIRTLLSIGAVCAILGLVLSVAGLCAGGRLTTVHVYWDHGPRVTYRDALEDGEFSMGITDYGAASAPQAPDAPDAPAAPSSPGTHHEDVHHGGSFAGEVRKLEIEIGGGRVILQTGGAYDLQVQGNPRYESKLSDGEWEICTKEKWNTGIDWNEIVFTVTVPADAEIDEISLTIGAGTLTADSLCCREAELTVGAGTMTLNDFVCTGDCEMEVGMGTLTIDGGALSQHTGIECGMGTVKLKVERPDDYGYAVSGGMGSVLIDGSKYAGMAIDTQHNTGAATFYSVECGMGTVQVEFLN